jgi:tetratricopeptide (TPR) repeat protein
LWCASRDVDEVMEELDEALAGCCRGRASCVATAPCGIRYGMSFEIALKQGRLEEARSMLEDLQRALDTGDLWLPECYADLAQAFDRRGQHEDAIAAMECAIEHGWYGRPDPRSDIAEFHLRAGRHDEAARIWAELKTTDPHDVWLYNAAGLSYSEVGDHELAVAWLGEGIELAIRAEDPEGIVPQLSAVRRSSLAALGRDLDELARQADQFVARWRDPRHNRNSWTESSRAAGEWLAAPEVGEDHRGGSAGRSGGRRPAAEEIAVAMAWFPAGEYEKAIGRWESLADDWATVPHPDYCRRMDGHIRWMRAHGIQIRAVAPIVVDEFVRWCEDHGEDPERARAGYAAERYRLGGGIEWPPGRNNPCWCGSGRKYKKCCGLAQAAPMHAGTAA